MGVWLQKQNMEKIVLFHKKASRKNQTECRRTCRHQPPPVLTGNNLRNVDFLNKFRKWVLAM